MTWERQIAGERNARFLDWMRDFGWNELRRRNFNGLSDAEWLREGWKIYDQLFPFPMEYYAGKTSPKGIEAIEVERKCGLCRPKDFRSAKIMGLMLLIGALVGLLVLVLDWLSIW